VSERRYEFQRLTRDLLEDYCGAFIEIDSDTVGEPWRPGHYAKELPGKWASSWVVLEGRVTRGFVIASLKEEGVHVHRIAVAREARGAGLGTRLLERVVESARRQGAERVTLRVSARNEAALRFYRRLGFSVYESVSELLSLRIPVADLAAACRQSSQPQGAQ
jgi:ribosomal protein S18 acetylase RimI-like enzyme